MTSELPMPEREPAICPRCLNPIPDNLLACAVCTTRIAAAKYADMQRDYLASVARRETYLATYAFQGVRHVLQFNAGCLSYCDIELKLYPTKRDERRLDELHNLCPDCLKAIAELAPEFGR